MKQIIGFVTAAIILILGSALLVFPAAVQQIGGLAVAQTATTWNYLKDLAQGDDQTSGVALVAPCLWNGSSCDRARGSVANGQQVDVTRIATGSGISPVEGTTLFNSINTSAANTALVVTLTGTAGTRVHLYKLTQVSCLGLGTSSGLTVSDGATLLNVLTGQIPSTPMSWEMDWPTGLTAATGANMVITLGACGTGVAGNMEIVADRF